MAEAEEAILLACYQSMRRNMLEDSSRQQPRWQNLGLAGPKLLKFCFLCRSVKVVTMYFKRCKGTRN